MRGTPGQRLTSAFSLCVPVLLGRQQAVVTGTGRGELCLFVGKVCASPLLSSLSRNPRFRRAPRVNLSSLPWRLPVSCAASGVCAVNKPLVRITCIILKSRKEQVCRRKRASPTPPPSRIATFRFTPEIRSTVCDLFINCDSVMNGFSRQILIKSSVTSLGLKQMSISNYGYSLRVFSIFASADILICFIFPYVLSGGTAFLFVHSVSIVIQ